MQNVASVTPSLRMMRCAAVLFFCTTSFFAVAWGRTHLPSPDETANAFFIRQYVQTGSFRVAEPLNVVAEDIVHPRAVQIVQHDLAPGSFLGMLLLYGWIAKIVGLWIVPLLTPIFATIASFFFYKLIRLIFDERIARWSFFLLLIHPAWIYYTARSMFPNVLFLSLLIIGIYYLVKCQMSNVKCFLASLLIGLALTVRTSEAPWVLGELFLLYFLFLRKIRQNREKLHYTELVPRYQFGIMRFLVFLVGLVIAFLPIFYYNNDLYGHPFYNGYSQIDSEAVPAAFAWHFQSRFLSTIFSLILPFGIKPFVLLQNAYQYLVWFFWWFAIPSILGIVFGIRHNHQHIPLNPTLPPLTLRGGEEGLWERGLCMFLSFYVFMLTWLLLYYGSWQFRDSTLLGATLGTSFTRYWLPVFVFGIPFAVYALRTLRKKFLRDGAILVMILFSLLTVLWRGDESLFALRRTALAGNAVTALLRARTESNAVILTERSDKLFFPERRVIFNDPLDQAKIDRVIAKLVRRVPVYYFTELEKHDIDFMNEQCLAQYGVAWKGREEIRGQRLYTLEAVSSKQ